MLITNCPNFIRELHYIPLTYSANEVPDNMKMELKQVFFIGKLKIVLLED